MAISFRLKYVVGEAIGTWHEVLPPLRSRIVALAVAEKFGTEYPLRLVASRFGYHRSQSL